jgi:sulfite reductase (ferredoxin)
MTPPVALPSVVEQELAKYKSTLDALHAGAIDNDKEFKPFRLVHGIYGTRQGGTTQMIRIKLKYGKVTSDQMRALADMSEKYTNGISHITTRQAIQYHYLKLDDTPNLLEDVEKCGLTAREACGNAVRAVCGSPNAGTLTDEPFDIDPYSEAVFQHFLRGPRSASLPRKFKIALASSDSDWLQQINIQDIGIMAVTVNGQQGFRIVAAGGLGSMPIPPVKLYDCLPKNELIPVCDALVRVHHKYGDRTNRAKARLKFVLKNKGEEGFKALFEEQLAEVRKEGITGKVLPDSLKPVTSTPVPVVAGDEGAWRKANCRAHREAGLAVVSVTVPRGDVHAREMRILADLADWFSEGDVRTTNDQNIIFRRVKHEHLTKLYQELVKIGYHKPAHGIVDVVSCPGASTCMLGICLSKNLAQELETALLSLPKDETLQNKSRINISGCPNSCGQHHIGTIGLHGAASKIGDKLIPHYVLFVGGGDEGKEIHHGTMVARIPARKAPETIKTLAGWYLAERKNGESFAQYLRRVAGADAADKETAKAAKNALKERLMPIFTLGAAEISEKDLYDYGSDKLFSLDELGAGECMS